MTECRARCPADAGEFNTLCPFDFGASEREISGEIRDARRKYGCDRVSSVRCGKDDVSQPGWMTCQILFSEGERKPEGEQPSNPVGAGDATCDLTILTNTLSYELFHASQKARRRYGCPLVESVHCVSDPQGWIDCALTSTDGDGTVPGTCSMAALTREISSEFGEEIADAEVKYQCPIPPHLSCA